MLHFSCPACHSLLQGPPEFSGRKVECPKCHELSVAPEAEPIVEAEVIPDDVETTPDNPWEIQFLESLQGPAKVRTSVEPPAQQAPPIKRQTYQSSAATAPAAPASAASEPSGPWMQRMLEALLDPRSITWLLTLGGGLMVLGGLIWLISQGILENPFVLALLLTSSSVAILVAGWFVTLKTRYRTAGRALTFLGCVVLPLNLWFYHAQGLLLLEGGLWVGGVACVLLYVATVWLLREPLFVYAVEAGITITSVLLLGEFGVVGQATQLCVVLMSLALISIHAHKAFPTEGSFTQDKYGMPLFWSGQLQLLAALVILATTQAASLLIAQIGNVFAIPKGGIPLTVGHLVPGCLWIAGAYAYIYSDLAVRRIGLYTYLSAICLIMAELTILGIDLAGIEGLIAAMALTAMAVSLVAKFVPDKEGVLARTIAPLALVLSVLPVLMGLGWHFRATSSLAAELNLAYVPSDGRWFLAAMIVIAIANRISAYIYQGTSRSLAIVYFFFSAAGLLLACNALLRLWGRETWDTQVPLLMLVPVGYMVAAWLWQGREPERPLAYVAHTAVAVILLQAMLGVAEILLDQEISPLLHRTLAIVFAEAAVFYALATFVRGQAFNVYLGVVASCAAAWQICLYRELPNGLFTIVIAAIGIALLALARARGLEMREVYTAAGDRKQHPRGRGLAVLRAGHGVLSMAIIVAAVKGVFQLIAVGLERRELTNIDWIALGLMIIGCMIAAVISQGQWRRGYLTAAIGLGGLAFVTLNVAIDISLWRKMEIFLVTAGLILLGVGYVGRFRDEPSSTTPETVSWALWMGSLLASLPLIVAVFYHWSTAWNFSLYDELALVTVTVLMLASGVVWRVKASTLLGGGTLSVYLVVLTVSLIYRPQVAIGIYLAAGGAAIFLVGLLLAMYRDRLIALPDRIAKREGIFSVIGWR